MVEILPAKVCEICQVLNIYPIKLDLVRQLISAVIAEFRDISFTHIQANIFKF
jgi:hypothetical protein